MARKAKNGSPREEASDVNRRVKFGDFYFVNFELDKVSKEKFRDDVASGFDVVSEGEMRIRDGMKLSVSMGDGISSNTCCGCA
jgi:hypothetical protein